MRLARGWILVMAGGLLLPAAAWGQPRVRDIELGEGQVTVRADRLEQIGPDDTLIATGNVEVSRGQARLLADRVEFHPSSGEAVAEGRVVFWDGDNRLTGRRVEYNFRTGTGMVHDGQARVAPYYRVSGQQMERLDEQRYRVLRGLFTTCEDDPPTWSFRFGRATVDFGEFVYGTGGSFWIRSLPLLPLIPVFAAPIRRDRQSGFLFPRLGHSSRKGFFAEVPFFWALSDSQDATVTLHGYTERGVGGELEYRYLLSEDHRGTVQGFFLKEFVTGDEPDNGHTDNRGWASLRHQWEERPDLGLRANVNGVSDDFVLRQYADRLQERAAQRVESDLFLTRTGPTAGFVADLFWYQDLTTRRAVELHRLPDLRLATVRQPLPALGPVTGLLWDLEASATHFVRDLGSDGTRGDLAPRLSRPTVLGGVLTLTPFVGGRLTAYDTTVTGTTVTADGLVLESTDRDPRLRRLVEAGADLELQASRRYATGGVWGTEAALHTVEPRLTFRWVEGSDLVRFTGGGGTRPNRLPQWDTVDAITEGTRLEYSLTNRLQARTAGGPDAEAVRWEAARLALGHSVELANPDRPLGDLVGQLILNPGRLITFRGDARYDLHGAGVRLATTDLTLSLPRLAASVGTRHSETENVGFLQGSARVELTRFAAARVATDWDLRTSTFVESRLGLELRWQCWGMAVEVVSRHRDEDEIRFSVNLLGLGGPVRLGAGLGG